MWNCDYDVEKSIIKQYDKLIKRKKKQKKTKSKDYTIWYSCTMSLSTESVEHFHINSPCPSDERKSNGAVTTASDQTDNNLIEKSIGSRTSSCDSGCDSDLFRFGWSKWQPKCMQSLLSAKWALFWMCWAGALQGNATRNYSLQTKYSILSQVYGDQR